MDERLRYLQAIADKGSFSAAARSLRVSQPALSTAIAKLERELEARLLDRSVTPVRPTEAGQLAVAAAEQLSQVKQRMRYGIGALERRRPLLRIGMIDSLATMYAAAPDGLRRLAKLFRVELEVNATSVLLGLLAESRLDTVAGVAVSRPASGGLESIQIGNEPLMMVIGSRASADVSQHFISYPSGSHTARLIRERLPAFPPASTIITSSSPEIMLQLVRQRFGAAVLPWHMVDTPLSEGALRVIRDAQGDCFVDRPISIYTSSDVRPALSSFISTLSKILVDAQTSAHSMV